MMLISRELDAGVVVLCVRKTGCTGRVNYPNDVWHERRAGEVHEGKEGTVARLQGRYQLAPAFILTVRADGEKLFVKATNQPEFRVYAESETEWKYRVVDAGLTFELPETGSSTAVTLHQFGRDMRAPRSRQERLEDESCR